jgi:hypothetical protein
MSLPGDRLRSWAARWCCSETMTKLIDPMIADLQLEHRIAAQRGRRWERSRIRVAFLYGFLKVAAVCGWRDVVSPAGWTTDDRKAIGGMVLWSVGFVAVLTALLELPFVSAPKVLLHPSPMRFVYLAPQALGLALTMGATLGLILGLGGRRVSRRVAAAVMTLSMAASIVSFTNMAWITPSANQAFQALTSGNVELVPGIPEMTLGEVSHKIDELDADPGLAEFGYLRALAFNYHIRWAIGVSPAIYAIFALSLGFGLRRRWVMAIIVLLSFPAYDGILVLMRPWNSGVPSYAAAWSANAGLLVASALMAAISAHPRRDRRVQVSS